MVAPSSLQLPPQAAALSWGTVVTWILVLGSLAKLCWLGIGFWQLRRYRKLAIPLSPIPDSIREASRIIGADALFCVSQHVTGPATLGHIDPVVLLPTSFKSLDAEAQRSIACHELLHVRRKDWLVTMVEEIFSAFLWFNPGAWWVLAQARLSREQLVDSEVVRLTAREPYVKALLSMAVVSRRGWALPAASFFNEGHLDSPHASSSYRIEAVCLAPLRFLRFGGLSFGADCERGLYLVSTLRRSSHHHDVGRPIELHHHLL